MSGRPEPESQLEHALREMLERAVPDGALRPPRLPVSAAAGADVGFSTVETAVGRLLLAVGPHQELLLSAFAPDAAAEERWLHRLSGAASPRLVRAPARTAAVREQIEEYLAGERRSFDVTVDLSLCTPFQRSVLARLDQDVPYGGRTTYGALAGALGRAGAARAVGSALGSNPVCVVLPCHRVLAGDGALTGYAGGVAAKDHLLRLEEGAR